MKFSYTSLICHRHGLARFNVLLALAVVGLAVAVYLLAQSNRALNSEVERLRPEVAKVEELKRLAADLPKRLKVINEESQLLKRELEELPALRNKARMLEEARQEAVQLKAENAQLVAAAQQLQRVQVENQQLRASVGAPRVLTEAEKLVAQKNACIANLKQLDGATQQWALENKLTALTRVIPDQVRVYIRGNMLPACPSGGFYSFGLVRDNPRCSIPGHGL
ncbi:MAG TPA: hypothetical protein VK968_08830 [Roseimicrobium sp.]|nr:hypothetical protein [Roseimicrobium sp.]